MNMCQPAAPWRRLPKLACGFECEDSIAGYAYVMGIGVGIFLLAIGAVLAFAVDWTLAGLDLHAVGWILMAAGVIGLVLFFYFWNRRRGPVPLTRQREVRADPDPYYARTTPVVAAPPVAASAPVAPPPLGQRAD
jgi:hypothetical protein